MNHFRVGLGNQIVNSRYSATAFARADMLTATASGADSYWVGDHLKLVVPTLDCDTALPRYRQTRTQDRRPTRTVDDARVSRLPQTLCTSAARCRRHQCQSTQSGSHRAGRRDAAINHPRPRHPRHRRREREGNEPYGVDWTKPVARFEEAIATIRTLWDSRGELVSRESPYFPLRNAVFDLPPYRGKWPEIWISAHGPRMLRATGRYADAWMPGLLMRPGDYARGLAAVKTAASDAGRDPASVTLAVWLFVFTGRSRDEVEESLSSEFAKAFALNIPAEMWASHGVQHPLGDDFAGGQDLVPQTFDEQTALSYVKDVPASLLKEALLTGTPADVIDQAAEWRDHGVRYLVVCNASILQPNLRTALASSAPLFKILRGLKKL